MDTETVSPNFDDIRPLNNSEVKDAIEKLVANEDFERALRYIKPNLNWEEFSVAMRACKTKEEFKSTLAYDAVMTVAKNTTFSLTISGRSRLPKDKAACTFISNHRDIVLDASFLNVMLYDVGYGMTQVAIGDNLLIRPWIETLVRLNNSFIVKRGVSVRQMLEVSKTLSAYIHHAIKNVNESVWIAQREGRAKDSDDRTQGSVLKMLSIGGDKDNLLLNLMDLNIVPVAISYEFDPCDFLKAKEFQLKRDNPHHKKTPADDLENMLTGINGYKGRVYFKFGEGINRKLDQLDPSLPKSSLLESVAGIIDAEIYKNYILFPFNYVAYDTMTNSTRFQSEYTLEDKEAFEAYVAKQLDKIQLKHKDWNFLREKIVEMYGNPVKNFLMVQPTS